MSFKYEYNLNDFSNNKFNLSRIQKEIETSNIITSIDYEAGLGGTSNGGCSINFKNELSINDKSILDNIIDNHSGEPLEKIIQTEVTIVGDDTFKKDTDNNVSVTIQPRLGSGLTLITHNFCDPCTWYTNAIKITDEIASVKVPLFYNVYKIDHDYLIDVEHGRISFEDNLITNYKIIVKVNDVVKTIGTDYTIDYEDGEITFTPSLNGAAIVKVTYYYATNSIFKILPTSNKKIKMENVECQFSINLDLEAYNFYFDTYVYDINNLPNKILYKRSIYKGVKDWLNESNNKLSTVIPAIGALTQQTYIFVWDYPASRVMKYSEGTEIQIYCKKVSDNSISSPIKTKSNTTGEIATGTFYCLSELE